VTTRPMWKTAAAAALPAAKLLARLARDERVPRRARWFALGALAYAIVPIDLIPDRIPLLGKVDDVSLVVLSVVRLVGEAPDDIVAEHWDGDEESFRAFTQAVEAIADVIPQRVHRLFEALAR
jgi:uncharacterized membrane protein YkvA (DUF1232 family)